MVTPDSATPVETKAQVEHPTDTPSFGRLLKIANCPKKILLHSDALVKAQSKTTGSIRISKVGSFPKPGNGLFWVHVHKNLKRLTMDSRLFA